MRNLIRTAAFCLLCLPTSALQGSGIPVTETVTLRTGNDGLGAPLAAGLDDFNVTQMTSSHCPPGQSALNEYYLALIGAPAKTVTPPAMWAPSIGDPDARWIHSDVDPAVLLPDVAVQYAHQFDLPADMPPNALVSIDMEYLADNIVREVCFDDGDSINPTALNPPAPQGNFTTPTVVSRSGTAADFGLSAGTNILYFRVCETDERASGLIYSVTLTIDYCKIEVEPMRSGFGQFPGDAEVDVVFLCDTTGSMGPIIDQIQSDTTVIVNDLASNYTQDIRVGIASYKDFNTTSSNPSPNHSTYAYRLEAPIVDISTSFGINQVTAAIGLWESSGGGGDGPEGQLYAFHRLSDDDDSAVGWRPDSIRIIVYIGDCPGHDPICPAVHNGSAEPFMGTGIGCDSSNPNCDGSFDLTEASVIAELNTNGLWGGTKVIAVNCTQPNVNPNFLQGLNSPPDGDNGNADNDYAVAGCATSTQPNQGTRISGQTGGSLITVTDPAVVTAAIQDAFMAVLNGGTAYPCGWPDPSGVLHQSLPSSNAYANLSNGIGQPSIVVCPNSNWISNLSGAAAWIHSSHSNNPFIDGTGRPPESVLHAHPFQLPSFPASTASVFFELEWAASDRLKGVSLNGDVIFPGGNLGVGGGTVDEYSYASFGSFTGPATSFNLNQGGLNRLYLSQEETNPFPSDAPDHASGIIYIAKMTISYPCENEIQYDTFCDCLGDWAVCMNPGGPGEGCANSTGAGAALTASGTGSSCTLHAANLPLPSTIGLFFVGSNSIGPFQLGDGLRCVGGDPVRLGIVSTTTGQANLFIGQTQPGQLYQFWYRDNSGPCQTGYNLSNAIITQ